jgi:penicillin-binding protein 1A
MSRALKTALAVVIVLLTPVTSAGVMLGAFLFLPLPADLPERVPPSPSQISRVYDAAGNEIGTYKQFETSIPVQKADIPKHLEQAVIAAEDRGFYSHGGVDVRGTLRAMVADLRNRQTAQGGSTITQQLVKNTVTGNDRSITRKIREAVLASQLDRQVDKDDILFEYLSVIYLGEGAYGVGAAAETYFRKPVSELTLSESATLAGLIPAPSRYSPRVDLAAAEGKRQRVLRAMLDQRMITDDEFGAAIFQPLALATQTAPGPNVTLVHPPEVQQTKQPYFTDYVARWLEHHLPGGLDQIYRGVLRIETTLDPALQESAQRHVADFLEGTEPDLRTSLVSIEPPTGFVRAFVSGRDFSNDSVNYALGAAGGGSGRQPGSAFKPFVLARAFQTGVTPNDTYSGRPHDVTEACGPKPDGSPQILKNYEGSGYGTLPLRNATWASVNTVFTRLILDVGVKETMDLARSMGLTTVSQYKPGYHCASVALGAESVSPLDMASAYGVFAARGERAEPTPVLRVIDRDGKVLIDNSKPKTRRVLDEGVADNVTDVLRGVLISGTAHGRGIDRPAAGKTGTTQDNKDAWFIGFTPTLSTSVWMGYENKTTATAKTFKQHPVHGRSSVTGGSFPAQLWQEFMRDALRNVPVTDFSEPAPIEAVPDAAKIRARRGFAPGARMYPRAAPEESYVVDVTPPQADAPTTTTTTEPPTSTTSLGETTTTEGDDGGGVLN